jgi:hypothetical protein
MVIMVSDQSEPQADDAFLLCTGQLYHIYFNLISSKTERYCPLPNRDCNMSNMCSRGHRRSWILDPPFLVRDKYEVSSKYVLCPNSVLRYCNPCSSFYLLFVCLLLMTATTTTAFTTIGNTTTATTTSYLSLPIPTMPPWQV